MRKWIIISAVLLFVCAIVVLALLNLNSLIRRKSSGQCKAAAFIAEGFSGQAGNPQQTDYSDHS